MCTHGLSVRQPCQRCADSYHRLIKIDEVDAMPALVLADPEVWGA